MHLIFYAFDKYQCQELHASQHLALCLCLFMETSWICNQDNIVTFGRAAPPYLVFIFLLDLCSTTLTVFSTSSLVPLQVILYSYSRIIPHILLLLLCKISPQFCIAQRINSSPLSFIEKVFYDLIPIFSQLISHHSTTNI